jgi:hypothetical protein
MPELGASCSSGRERRSIIASGWWPGVVGGPLLAPYADRLPRRAVMIVCDVARALLVTVLAWPGTPLIVAIVLLTRRITVALLNPYRELLIEAVTFATSAIRARRGRPHRRAGPTRARRPAAVMSTVALIRALLNPPLPVPWRCLAAMGMGASLAAPLNAIFARRVDPAFRGRAMGGAISRLKAVQGRNTCVRQRLSQPHPASPLGGRAVPGGVGEMAGPADPPSLGSGAAEGQDRGRGMVQGDRLGRLPFCERQLGGQVHGRTEDALCRVRAGKLAGRLTDRPPEVRPYVVEPALA